MFDLVKKKLSPTIPDFYCDSGSSMWMILKESGDEQEVPSALLANSLLANKFYRLKILQLASPHSKVVSFEKIPIG